MSATSISLHLPALFSGLLPLFSEFFEAVFMHYHIHVSLHDPRSVILFSSFAFLCEAFLGICPFVALLSYLFLQLTAPVQCSGCVSLQAADAMASECIDMENGHFAKGFT
ncbi:hypothetical protein D1007_44038 [Hordeum vulgare]|nr:hypothetical protein D1007_61391 [Hordeum vulgare]KAE8782598.1 hypothetical protein D1007_44038 [Hordeum vulgare]